MDNPEEKKKEEAPDITKLSLQDAFLHLYQLEKHDYESDEDYIARKIARDDFEKKLAEQGLTIQALVAMGQISQKRIIVPK